jgi:hypothetical protein
MKAVKRLAPGPGVDLVLDEGMIRKYRMDR